MRVGGQGTDCSQMECSGSVASPAHCEASRAPAVRQPSATRRRAWDPGRDGALDAALAASLLKPARPQPHSAPWNTKFRKRSPEGPSPRALDAPWMSPCNIGLSESKSKQLQAVCHGLRGLQKTQALVARRHHPPRSRPAAWGSTAAGPDGGSEPDPSWLYVLSSLWGGASGLPEPSRGLSRTAPPSWAQANRGRRDAMDMAAVRAVSLAPVEGGQVSPTRERVRV